VVGIEEILHSSVFFEIFWQGLWIRVTRERVGKEFGKNGESETNTLEGDRER
jgi:hypothetical protein